MTREQNREENELIYIWDAYCGWCYGFSPALSELHANHPELPLSVWSGGLFTGSNRQPIGAYSHIADANVRISELTGVRFGDAFEEVLKQGTAVMDSEKAARGFAALRSQAPERSAEIASALQKAFYLDGRSLNEPETYRLLAHDLGLDADLALTDLNRPETAGSVAEEFARVARIGVQGFPALLLRKGDSLYQLGGGATSAATLEERLASVLG